MPAPFRSTHRPMAALARARRFAVVQAAVLSLLSGCTLRVVEVAPLPAVPPQSYTLSDGPSDTPLDRLEQSWWLLFGDEALTQLVDTGLAGSPALHVMFYRVQQAEAAARRRQSFRGPEFGLSARGSTQSQRGAKRSELREIGVGGVWEVNLFGAQRQSALAGLSLLQAREEELAAARLGLSAQIVRTYLDLVTVELLHSLLHEQIANAQDYLNILQARAQQGIVSQLDVLQQASQVAEISSQLPPVRAEMQRARIQLSILTGQNLPSITQQLSAFSFPQLPERPRLGEPIELLSQRPDLRAARHELVSADAEAAAFLAEKWPTLTASVNAFWREGVSIEGGIVSIALGAFQPLFDSGRRQADLDGALAVVGQRRSAYASVFLGAIGEIEDAVFTEQQQVMLLNQLDQRRALIAETLAQAMERYASGLTDLLPVITARENLNTIEQRILRETRNQLKLRVDLHTALGGPIVHPPEFRLGVDRAFVKE